MDAGEEVEVLARTVFGEARGESFRGQLAVAWVVRNRADRPSWWGKTVKDVCLKPKQFSCWNEGDPNLPIITAVTLQDQRYRSCFRAALSAYDRSEKDPTFGATHYFTTARPKLAQTWPPEWAMEMIPLATIGAHEFCAERG